MTRQLGSRYELDEQIGRGAMGEVWSGRDITTNELIAAKLLHQEHTTDNEIVGRFVQERAILLSLDHKNIVRVRDLVTEGSNIAIVMDLVEGSDLRSHLRSAGRLKPRDAVAITGQVLDALTAAHKGKVLHRDVKPENVLLDRQGNKTVVRLTDFGISRLAEGTAVRMSQLIGTAEYMAPETIAAEVVSDKSDVYAAGIMLYELLAGRTPFGGKGQSYAIVHRQVHSAPPKLDALPPALWNVIDQMLVKDPNARPNAAAAKALLASIASTLTELSAIPAPAEVTEWESLGEVRYTSTQTQLKGLERPEKELAPTPAWAERVVNPGDDNATSVVDRPNVKVERPDPGAYFDEGVEQKPRNKNALYVGGAVAAVGVLVALFLMGGGGGKSGTAETGDDNGGATVTIVDGGGDSGSATGTHKQATPSPNAPVQLSRTYSMKKEKGQWTLTANLTYSTRFEGAGGPVVEVIPKSLLAQTNLLPEWQADNATVVANSKYYQGNRAWTVTLPAMQPDTDVTVRYSLRGINLGDTKPEAALAKAYTDAQNDLKTLLDSAKPADTELLLMGIQGLQIDPPIRTTLGSQVPVAVYALLSGNSSVLLFDSRGPSNLVGQMFGGPSNFNFLSSGSSCFFNDSSVNTVTLQTAGPCTLTAKLGQLTGSAPFTVSGV